MDPELAAEILGSEPLLRLGVLLGMLGLMAAWEGLRPRRPATTRRRRWTANLALVAIDAAAVRLLLPAATVGIALFAENRGWGLLPLLDLPTWLALAASLILLDLALYLQHVATHKIPLLWRLHRVHHSDLAIDVTTAVRFHPIEILLSLAYKGAVVVMLGAPAVAVLLFELLLNGSALFNHGNVRLPPRLDAILRRLWVTPDMHRIHHSVERDETDSNYGTCLSLWDRLFGTYRAQPRAGHEGLVIGLAEWRDDRDQRLWNLLAQPFAHRAPRGGARP